MKITLSREQFKDHFMAIRPDNFSREGLGEIFFYFEEMGEENEMEFDPIAICCSFSQCSVDEFLDAFQVADDEDRDYLRNASLEEKKEAISQYIDYNGFWYSFVEDGKEIVFENF
jgi:hypothetical protein